MTTRPLPDRRTARRAVLPVVIGPLVLVLCWTSLGLVASARHAACWGGLNIADIAGPLALNYRFYANVSPALPLVTYAAQALCAYLLLFAFGLVALRRRAQTAFVAIAVYGTAIVSLFYCVGYIVTYSDLANGGFLCDLGFELIPYVAFALALAVVIVGWLTGWLTDRRTGAPAGR